MEVHTVYESERQCGYRKPGASGVGLYLVGPPYSEPCERLPFPLKSCPTCGGGMKHSRGFTWVEPNKLFASKLQPRCNDRLPVKHHHRLCAMCTPVLAGDRAGLIWVGAKFYPDPASFNKEAERMGVCRKIPAVPRGFEIGIHWVYLAHIYGIPEEIKVCGGAAVMTLDRVPPAPGVFSCFLPTRLEIVIKDANAVPEAAEKLWKKHGDEKVKLLVVKPEEGSNLFKGETNGESTERERIHPNRK